MNKESYQAYLRSPEWKEKRKELLEEVNHECEDCGSDKNLQVHHLNYDNLGEEELGEDVEVLCRDCHEDKEIEKGTDLYEEEDYGEY